MEALDYLNMRRDFKDRDDLIDYIKEEFAEAAERNPDIPKTRGGRAAALQRLEKINPARYSSTRNYLDGDVSYLSPYIRHGVLSLAEVRDRALAITSPKKAEKFVNELCWRDYWQKVYTVIGNDIWESLEPYKTGFSHDDYADDLPEDIRNANTDSPCINTMIRELYTTGYLHNRLRMYLAAYVVHWRRVKWQTGAAWFLEHLLDGDPASNNLSWQWVASTFGSKPYIFNQSNMDKYLEKFGGCGHKDANFKGSYEKIAARLFPNGQGSTGHADNDYKQRLKKVTFVDPKATGDFTNPIVWIHGDNMNPTNPALTLYPQAPAIWVWDEDLLDDYHIALKRILFMYENLLEMPDNLVIRRGNVYSELAQFADEHNADGIVVMNSPSPRFDGLVNKLDKQIPVKIMLERPIVTHDGPYDLRRFSRYWRTAQNHAFE
ncbi:MAG: FAD-binding domain-containing protein [Chloroflexota bacterium]